MCKNEIRAFFASFFKKSLKALSHFCFPPFCLNCDRLLSEDVELLCAECQTQLEMIDPEVRCLYCFSSEVFSKKRLCSSCFKQSPLLHRVGASFDDFGTAHILLGNLRRGRPYLAKGMAGYMALQWVRLDWPLPDWIVPVPSSFSRRFERGYDQRAFLAQELGKILDRPVWSVLRRASFETEPPVFQLRGLGMGRFRQGVMQGKERKLFGMALEGRQTRELQDKKILLVDDFFVTGETFKAAAKALLEEAPQEIYGLTFCRGM